MVAISIEGDVAHLKNLALRVKVIVMVQKMGAMPLMMLILVVMELLFVDRITAGNLVLIIMREMIAVRNQILSCTVRTSNLWKQRNLWCFKV